jgi:hypothetical protein
MIRSFIAALLLTAALPSWAQTFGGNPSPGVPASGGTFTGPIAAPDFTVTGGSSLRAYDMLFFFPGTMINAQLLARVVIPRTVIVPINCTGSRASPATNATSTTVLAFQKNGGAAGSVSVATNGVATFTCASATTFAAGDILTVTGPATADATLADVSLTLVGSL